MVYRSLHGQALGERRRVRRNPGRNEQKGSALVGEIKAEGGEALFLVSNVLDKALLEQNKQEILKAYGRLMF